MCNSATDSSGTPIPGFQGVSNDDLDWITYTFDIATLDQQCDNRIGIKRNSIDAGLVNTVQGPERKWSIRTAPESLDQIVPMRRESDCTDFGPDGCEDLFDLTEESILDLCWAPSSEKKIFPRSPEVEQRNLNNTPQLVMKTEPLQLQQQKAVKIEQSSIKNTKTSSNRKSKPQLNASRKPKSGRTRKRRSSSTGAIYEKGRWSDEEIMLLLQIARAYMNEELKTIGDIALYCGINRPSRGIDKQLKRLLVYERWIVRDQADLLRQIENIISSGKYEDLTEPFASRLASAQTKWTPSGP